MMRAPAITARAVSLATGMPETDAPGVASSEIAAAGMWTTTSGFRRRRDVSDDRRSARYGGGGATGARVLARVMLGMMIPDAHDAEHR
jgi:hypothetical protein